MRATPSAPPKWGFGSTQPENLRPQVSNALHRTGSSRLPLPRLLPALDGQAGAAGVQGAAALALAPGQQQQGLHHPTTGASRWGPSTQGPCHAASTRGNRNKAKHEHVVRNCRATLHVPSNEQGLVQFGRGRVTKKGRRANRAERAPPNVALETKPGVPAARTRQRVQAYSNCARTGDNEPVRKTRRHDFFGGVVGGARAFTIWAKPGGC